MTLNLPQRSDLLAKAKSLKAQYQSADPFPHIVMDNFFPPDSLNEVLSEFPDVNGVKWRKFKSEYELKLASRSEDQFGEQTKSFMHYMNSSVVLDFLSELTGIPNLIADPYFNGGGMHQIQKGGHLKVHADFNKDSRTGLDRRINLLVYLNQNWKEEYGGHFELWDKQMQKAEVRVLPIFNRVAIFSTTSDSYHGHPDALDCPDGWTRKSLALYYYTNGRADENPELKSSTDTAAHSTLFQLRDNEKHLSKAIEAKARRAQNKAKIKNFLLSFVPPILLGKTHSH